MASKRVYAIGDIHGYLDKLHGAHALVEADRVACGDVDSPLVHVGDLVDRGPNSAGVVSYLMDGIAAGKPWVVLKGNHDRMFVQFLEDRHHDAQLRRDLSWMHPRLGGVTTMASYGVEDAFERDQDEVQAEGNAKVPAEHLAFLRGLDTYYRDGDVLFVHAGIRPGVAIEDQDEDDLLWIRDGWLDDTREHGALVVHGHTMVDAATHYGNRVNIDSGAGRDGPMTAVVIEDGKVWTLGSDGRTALLPLE